MGVKMNLIPTKMKDIQAKEIIYLHKYKEYEYIHAYQYSGYMVEGKYLVCRMKNCAQRLLDPEHIVYPVRA